MNIETIVENITDAQTQFVKDCAAEELLIKDWEYNQQKLVGFNELDSTLIQVQILFQNQYMIKESTYMQTHLLFFL